MFSSIAVVLAVQFSVLNGVDQLFGVSRDDKGPSVAVVQLKEIKIFVTILYYKRRFTLLQIRRCFMVTDYFVFSCWSDKRNITILSSGC